MYEVTEFKGCKRGLIELPACFVYKHLSTHFHYGEHFATILYVTVRWRYDAYYLSFTCHFRSHYVRILYVTVGCLYPEAIKCKR